MSLMVYNSLSKAKEKFEPHSPGVVKMYCCGPTVYDLLHVGNFRGAIFYNFVRHWLEHLGFKVTYVYNYTDVDDKIIDRAKKENADSSAISEKYIEEFRKDFFRLGLKPQDHNPKVTEFMQPILSMVKTLIEKKHAYVSGGEVLYSIKSFPEYGKLSHRNPDDLKVGVRIEIGDKKQDPLDFTLWKPSKEGEPSWPSDWGPGRPGWHIECSAMAKSILGDQIDIHGGGMDLIFPHHENEIAQSEACNGKHFVKYWLHNNMLNFGGAKMSKSLGNVRTGRSFMDEYNPEIFKFMILSVHYRSISDFSDSGIEHAISGLARIYSALAVAQEFLPPDNDGMQRIADEPSWLQMAQDAWINIEKSCNDDFNTPEAFAQIFTLVRTFNGQVKRGLKPNPAIQGKAKIFTLLVKRFGQMMALFQENPKDFLRTLDEMLMKKKNIDKAKVEELVQQRVAARTAKDFKKSDELRDQLLSLGIVVADTPQGSFWEVVK